MADSPALPFTGERLVPGRASPDLYAEHVARYRFAAALTHGRTVLDAGCGAGYGAQLLAEGAAFVAAVDIATDAVRYATRRYAAARLGYAVGSVERLPFPDGTFDLVVSFEVIEHVPHPERLLRELSRVLAPGGIAILSTPNKRRYSDPLPGYVNPFHHREYYPDEWRQLLQPVFPALLHAAQDYAQALTIRPVVASPQRAPLAAPHLHHLPGEGDQAAALDDALYFVTICARDARHLPAVSDQLFLLAQSHTLAEKDRWIDALRRQLGEAHTEVERCNEVIRALQGHLAEQSAWAQASAQAVVDRDATIRHMQARLAAHAAPGKGMRPDRWLSRWLADRRRRR